MEQDGDLGWDRIVHLEDTCKCHQVQLPDLFKAKGMNTCLMNTTGMGHPFSRKSVPAFGHPQRQIIFS